MWTPRRVVLLLGGVLLFAGAYGFYAHCLGWLDGLPQLPERLLAKAPPGFEVRPKTGTISPTIERLRHTFAPALAAAGYES